MDDVTPDETPDNEQWRVNAARQRYPILKFFEFEHLPGHLQELSRPFCSLAWDVAKRKPEGNAETATALRKLLEAKDCAVRAGL